MSPQIAIIADDLTGALDSGAVFASLGLRVLAATGLGALPQVLAAGAEVVAVALSSREIAADAAAARAGAAAGLLAGAGLVLKKVDSRLKGNVAAEVAEIVAQLGVRRVLACPAIPGMGRVVRKGALEGAGVARPIPVAAAFGDPGVPVDCPDAESDADLDELVAAAVPGTLFVGARGLAAALARRVGRGAVAAPSWRGAEAFVLGSRDPITLAQVERLRAAGGVEWIGAPDGVVPACGTAPGRGLVVQAVPGAGASGAVVSDRLAKGFAAQHAAGRGVLVLSGGETAGAVLDALGVGALEVLGEVQPGLPLCRALDNPGGPAIITKSGGFGDPDSLLRLCRGFAAISEGQRVS